MRRLAVVAAFTFALAALPTLANAQAGQAAPAPQTQKPAAPAAEAPKPFPEGARIGYLNIQQVAGESAEGKSANARVQALRDKKLQELQAKNKQLEAAQQKLTGGNLLSADARGQTQKEVDRLTVEIQRAQQDADAELNELSQELNLEFQRKLGPVIQQVSQERGLHLLLSQSDAGIIWADPGLDLTAEIIKRFDAAAGTAKPPAPPKQP
ncbi:MAG TPA: OmpH family outer membrane protein [Vicinamibacterales bacterium]|nr:OmpH family outer membrane protein [Vicinamibacterales bacterium]